MHHSNPIQRGRFTSLLIAAAMLVAGGDMLFWQQGAHGGQLGFYLIALLIGAVVMRPVVWHDRRSWIAAIAAALYALAYVREPGPLAWTMFWIAASMLVLLPATRRFDDGWRWSQRVLIHWLRTLVAPIRDFRRVAKIRRRRVTGPLSFRGAIPVLALPLIGSLLTWHCLLPPIRCWSRSSRISSTSISRSRQLAACFFGAYCLR